MPMTIREVLCFSCPSWQELPPDPLFNHEVVDYLNQALQAISHHGPIITSTMIQNYVKGGFLTRPQGRKYTRDHLAQLIIISIFKQVLTIDQVKAGMDLQLRHGSLVDQYNRFVEIMNDAIYQVFSSINNSEPQQKNLAPLEDSRRGLLAVSYAFAYKLLAQMMIDQGGYQEMRNDDE